MKKGIVIFGVLLSLVLLSACGRGSDGSDGSNGIDGHDGAPGSPGAPGAPGAPYTPPVVSNAQADVNALIDAENEYREGLGQTSLTAGLSCTLYTVVSGDRIQASISGHNTLTGISQVATFLFKGQFNQPDSPVSQQLNVLPTALRPLYTNMYLLRCQGQIVVRNSDYVPFELTSDDGSVLYIDGAKVIDNDNNHGSTMVQGMKYLRRGVHTFRLDYAQTGAGNQSLILTSGGSQIDPMYMAH